MNRHPRRTSDKHLAFIRTLPSLVYPHDPSPIEAAHVRYFEARYGKRLTGKAEKPDDCWAVPLGAAAHREQHSGSERAFWSRHDIDPLLVAALLWANTGDEQACRMIIANARSIGRG